MLKPGTEIQFSWDEYEVYYNTDYEYLGTETKYGVVCDYEDNTYEQDHKKRGLIKIFVPAEKTNWNNGICWLSEDDKSIVILTKWMKFKMWLKKHFGYKIMIVKL